MNHYQIDPFEALLMGELKLQWDEGREHHIPFVDDMPLDKQETAELIRQLKLYKQIAEKYIDDVWPGIEEEREKNKREEYRKKKEAEREARIGYIYMLKHDDHYKIGRAKDLKKRMWGLTCDLSPHQLITSAKVQDTYQTEMDLHSKYHPERRRGEWFILTTDQVDEIRLTLKRLEIP